MDVSPDPDFDAIYRANVAVVWRFLRRSGVPDSLLEDATQEVFLVFHRRRDECRGTSTERTWLLGIARGVAANTRRGRQRFLRRLGALHEAPPPATPHSPEDRAARAEARRLIEEFLGTLPEVQREVFALVEIEGLRQREVAEHLDISINTVGSRLRVARTAFQAYFTQLHDKEVAHG